MSSACILAAGLAALLGPVKPAVEDVARPSDPRSVKLEGWVGDRIAACEKNRLLAMDEER